MIVRLPNPMCAVVWLAFLVPASLFGGWADRSLGVSAFLLGGALLIAKPSPWEARRPAALALKIFMLLELSYVLSALYSAGYNGIQVGPLDYFELLRYAFLGVFVAYLIRHYDAKVRAAMDWAMIAALYGALLFPVADPQGFISVLSLCYLIFFSRLRLRSLHAATALIVIFFSAARASWMAALLILSAAASVRLYRDFSRRGAKSAIPVSLAFCSALLASAAVLVSSNAAAGLLVPAAAASPQALEFIRRSPIFGWGPAEYGGIPPGEYQYLLWLLKGGLLGAGLILAGSWIAGSRLLGAARGNPAHRVGAAAFLASVVLMLFSGQFFEGFRMFFVTAFLMAGIHQAAK